MFRFLKSFFIEPEPEPEIIVGEIYALSDEPDNPFKKASAQKVEVLDVQGGYVNYRFLGMDIFQDESMEKRSFIYCYDLVGSPCNPGKNVNFRE